MLHGSESCGRDNSRDDFVHGLLDQDLDDDLENLNAEIGFSDDDEDGSALPARPQQAPIAAHTIQGEDVVREEVEVSMLGPSRPQVKHGAAAVVVPPQLGGVHHQHNMD